MNHLFPRHLLGIEGLTREAAIEILDTADTLSHEGVSVPATLQGKTVLMAFFESSTRTRVSFEMAAKRLGAQVVTIAPSTSSVSKGESLLDTVRTVAAMGSEIAVVRHARSGAALFLADRIATTIINAGDGTHEHPTQALLDALTIRRKLGRIEGLTIAICGDVAHSRVARSGALLLRLLGAHVRFAGPPTLLPPGMADAYGVSVYDRIEPALEGADVVMALRVQQERIAGNPLPSLREYNRIFGLNEQRLALAKPGAWVMHPGPMNRGVEIDGALADGPRSLVLDQVKAGVAIRTAVLHLVATHQALLG